ncbi:hypothetical protein Pmani_040140, partial [Petrolisthes manimaculis]
AAALNSITASWVTRRTGERKQRTAYLERSINSVSTIDTMSRIMFPLSYGLLNLWYWYSYYDTVLVFNWTDPGFDDMGFGMLDKNLITSGERGLTQ